MDYDDISNLINGSGAVVSQRVYRIAGFQLNELIQRWKEAGKEEAMQCQAMEMVAKQDSEGMLAELDRVTEEEAEED